MALVKLRPRFTDCLEFTAINGNQIFSAKCQSMTQQDELPADAFARLAVVFSDVEVAFKSSIKRPVA
ncbi:hypothetical protein BK671_14420 [Pseudomonas fluorescens]|uniref:Uncharacterized protein n=1 Tax=Pseudomonas fluorescens TaxID=294 RepID=A0A423LFS9_PSEFL|nr:hypothetical protein BK671_14420 [Pseudomonas fluorescens]